MNGIAAGSAAERHYHLRLAADAALIPRSAGETLLAETTRTRKMPFVLLRRVREAIPNAHHRPTTPDPRQETLHREPQTNDT